MTRQRCLLLAAAIGLYPIICTPAPSYGANLSLPIVKKEPPGVRGFQFMFNYDPDRYHWRGFNLYFDGGYSHFNVPEGPHSSISIYSIAPVVRYAFKQQGLIKPFLEASIGLSYLNQTKFEERKLGIHFAFQDRLGIGALLGKAKHINLGVHAVHYSNAHLSANNSGITVPLVLDIGYRFN